MGWEDLYKPVSAFAILGHPRSSCWYFASFLFRAVHELMGTARGRFIYHLLIVLSLSSVAAVDFVASNIALGIWLTLIGAWNGWYMIKAWEEMRRK